LPKKPLNQAFLDLKPSESELVMMIPSYDLPLMTPSSSGAHPVVCPQI